MDELNELIGLMKRESAKAVLGVVAVIGLSVLTYTQISDDGDEDIFDFEEPEVAKVVEEPKRKPASIDKPRKKVVNTNIKRESESQVNTNDDFLNDSRNAGGAGQDYANYGKNNASNSNSGYRGASYYGGSSSPSRSLADYYPDTNSGGSESSSANSNNSNGSTGGGTDSGVGTGTNPSPVNLPLGVPLIDENENETEIISTNDQNDSNNNNQNSDNNSNNSNGGGSSNGGGGGSGGGGSGGGSSSLTCSSNVAEGTHTSTISITLSCSEASDIYFCVQAGGGCCDPVSTPTTYTSAINITTPNSYCVSFYGEAQGSSDSTTTKDLAYTISSSPLNMAVSFDKTQIQTTELALINQVGSSDFGLTDTYFHQINFKDHDPTPSSLNWQCSDYLSNHGTLTAPTTSYTSVSNHNYVLASLTSSNQIQTEINTDFVYGTNHIASIIEDRGRNVWNCQVQEVVFRDFEMHEFQGSQLPVFSGSPTNFGSFGNFGPYTTGASVSSGANEDTQGTTIHQSGLVATFY